MQPHNTMKPVTNDLDSEVSQASHDSRKKCTETPSWKSASFLRISSDILTSLLYSNDVGKVSLLALSKYKSFCGLSFHDTSKITAAGLKTRGRYCLKGCGDAWGLLRCAKHSCSVGT